MPGWTSLWQPDEAYPSCADEAAYAGIVKAVQVFCKLSQWGYPARSAGACPADWQFRLDVQNRVLRLGEKPVALTPKAFDVLLLLIQHSGQVVNKDELMKVIWPDSFVEESNLTQTVFMLRKALGETPDHRYILTVQGRGYRFASEVKEVSGSVAVAPQTSAPPLRQKLPSRNQQTATGARRCGWSQAWCCLFSLLD